MNSLNLEVPAMYGDHHVTAVRGLLLALPGVTAVYASSAFRIVDVEYDPALLSPTQIQQTLQTAGYGDELPIPAETGKPAHGRQTGGPDGRAPFFRHTAAYAQTGQTVSFAQQVPLAGRPLWPCPGMAPARPLEEEETTHG
ncbi:MAG: heavy-metal-associated domain-containing protein [Anaerolineales bacterium]|nr:heavy-metal-associated domain-containing protein [Anaerolineales bacterium]